MKVRPNLKIKKYISLLIWGLYFGIGFLINFTFLEQYYGPIWIISTLVALMPYLYWASLPVKLSQENNNGLKAAIYYKISVAILIFSFLLMSLSLVLFPPLVGNDSDFIPTMGGFLFFASLITCFIIGARALVQEERQLLDKPSNGFLAFITFFYLPIGIFFLVGRMQKLYDRSLQVFD